MTEPAHDAEYYLTSTTSPDAPARQGLIAVTEMVRYGPNRRPRPRNAPAPRCSGSGEGAAAEDLHRRDHLDAGDVDVRRHGQRHTDHRGNVLRLQSRCAGVEAGGVDVVATHGRVIETG